MKTTPVKKSKKREKRLQREAKELDRLSARLELAVEELDRISVGSIDYGIGVLRGVLGSDVRSRLSAMLVANIEQSIQNMRGAARYIERMQREQRRKIRA